MSYLISTTMPVLYKRIHIFYLDAWVPCTVLKASVCYKVLTSPQHCQICLGLIHIFILSLWVCKWLVFLIDFADGNIIPYSVYRGLHRLFIKSLYTIVFYYHNFSELCNQYCDMSLSSILVFFHFYKVLEYTYK